MGFFDDKEDVIDLQLTQYGKHRLSMGHFNPTFYAFFDDDVLYDGAYAGMTNEAQNDIEDRIREVPKTKAQYVFTGIETEIRRVNRLVRAGDVMLGAESIQPTADRHFSVCAALGNASLESDKAPAYHVRFLDGELSGSVEFITGSHQTVRIPQLNTKIEYKTSIGRDEPMLDQEPEPRDQAGIESQEVDFDRFATQLPDGTFVSIEEDQLILMIDERNVPFLGENFDIEVFLVEEETDTRLASGSDPKTNLIPLSFVKPPERIRNNLLLDEEPVEEVPELDPTYVEYFFDVNVDNEIDRFELCKALSEEGDKSRGLLADQTLDCPERKDIESKDIYRSDVDEFEECEED